MTVSLGGLALSDNLILYIGGLPPGYSQRRLIGGASVVQADGSSGGRALTLKSARSMTLGQLEQINNMMASGLSVTLVHHRGTFRVLITDTSEMVEDFNRANPDSDPTLTVSGNITLIEV